MNNPFQPENTPHSPQNPHVDTGSQPLHHHPNPQPDPASQADPNPYNPHHSHQPGAEFSAGPQQPGNAHQAGPQQPPPNPKQLAEDRYAEELKNAWNEYQHAKDTADALGKRGDINLEIIAKIKQNASEVLSKKIAEASERFAKQSKQAEHQEQQQSSFFGSHPPHARKTSKLYRSENDKMIAGVCGGLGEFFGFDSSIIRILFIIAAFIGFPISPFLAVFAYIAFAVILPVKTSSGEFRRMF